MVPWVLQGGGGGCGDSVRVRRVAQLRRDERPDAEPERVALQPHLPLRLRDAQGRRLRDGVRRDRRRDGQRDRRLRQPARHRAGPVGGAGRRDGAAAAAVAGAAVPAAAEPVRAGGPGRRDGPAATVAAAVPAGAGLRLPARGVPVGPALRVRRRRKATWRHVLMMTLSSVTRSARLDSTSLRRAN